MRLKNVASVRVSNVDKKSVDGEIPVRLCNYTDVYYSDRIRDDRDFMTATATDDQVSTFVLRPGQTLITKDSETADDIGVPAFVDTTAPDLVCGYHLAQITPQVGSVVPSYLFWALASRRSREQLSINASGVTRFGLRTDAITNLEIPMPQVERQRRIADFLDAETSRIDALIAAKEAMATLLEERAHTAAEDALAPAPGEPRVRLGSLLSEVDSRLGGAPVPELLSVSIHRGVVPFSEVTDRPARAESFEKYKICEAGDIAVNRLRAFQGGVGLVRSRGIVSPDYLVLRPASPLDGPYLHCLMRSPWFIGQMTAVLRGIGEPGQGNVRTPRVNWKDLRQILVPELSAPSRATTADLVTTATEKSAAAAEALTRQVELLRERRQALITAAVSGELDVT